MADTDTKPELSKEVLAPAENIREDLVATAVKFLQNPKVHQSPLSQKKAFLQRKGLTAEEIDVAVSRAGVKASPDVIPSHQTVTSGQPGQNSVIAVRDPYVSTWVKVRDIMAVVSMVTGLSYAAYKLYKELIAPWLFGLQTREQRIEKLEKTVTESIANVNTTLAAIEETLGKQQEKLQLLSHDVNSKTGGSSFEVSQNNSSINEIKTELSSIKGLLLNRRQFPPIPQTAPILPAWQLASNSGAADYNNKGAIDSTEVTNNVTFSSSPAPENSGDASAKNSDLSGDSAAGDAFVAKNRSKLENDPDTVQIEADDSDRENSLD